MADETDSKAAQRLSIVSGPPLSDEPGLGVLTLAGFLREVTQTYSEREALVWRAADGVTRWTYAQLWERAIDVARALRACGLGKDARVGILMTNRPEWLAAIFGTSLAGVVYDAVGGVSTPAALASPAHRGRLVVISAVGARAVEIDLRDLYRNETRILGADSTKLSVVESAPRLERMRPYFESGEFRPLPITATYPLDEGYAAYQAVTDHISGRVVIRPDINVKQSNLKERQSNVDQPDRTNNHRGRAAEFRYVHR